MSRGTILKMAVSLGLGASGGYAFAYSKTKDQVVVEPPKFDFGGNSKSKIVPRKRRWSYDYDWGPVTSWDYNWDGRHFEVKEVDNASNGDGKQMDRKIPKATRNLILIRHGQYNLKGTNDQERYLTELGRSQAQMTGLRLAELDLPLTYMVSSTMTRAIETAGLIKPSLPGGLEIKPNDPILAEGDPYPPEPPSTWKTENSFHKDGARIEAAFRKYFHRAEVSQTEDSYEVIVCHANVIRYFVCRALQLPPEAWLRISLKHASLTHVAIRPSGNVSIRTLGDAGHFPPKMLTTM